MQTENGVQVACDAIEEQLKQVAYPPYGDAPVTLCITSTLDLSKMQSAVHQFEYATFLWPVFSAEIAHGQESTRDLTLRTF